MRFLSGVEFTSGSPQERQLIRVPRAELAGQMAQDERYSFTDDELVTRIEPLIIGSLSEDINLEIKPAKDLWPVRIDGSQMENALVNLAVNARDATHGGGILVIETNNTTLDESHADECGAAEPGEYVALTVSDTGVGIADDIDLLFTDMVMPGGMTGAELVNHARESDPNLKVLYTSGFSDSMILEKAGAQSDDRVLNKPYRTEELAQAIRETLDARSLAP